jgi:hypothetical protein
MNELIAVLVGAVGPSGALIWFMYHTTSKTIPDIVAQHRLEIANLVQQFREDLSSERDLRRTIMAEVIRRATNTCPYGHDHHPHPPD